MNNKIEYRIMGVPSRLGNIHYLQEQLDITDKETFIDTEYRHNPMWTWKQTAKLQAENGTTHLCIIQDDTVLPKHFTKFCEKMVKKYPKAILKLYNYKNLDKFLPRGCVFTPNCNIGGVTTILPLEYVNSIIEVQEKDYPNCIHDDYWIVFWAYHHNVDVYNTYPSIVDTFKETEMGHEAKKMHLFCKDTQNYHWVDARNIILSKKHDWSKPVGAE